MYFLGGDPYSSGSQLTLIGKVNSSATVAIKCEVVQVGGAQNPGDVNATFDTTALMGVDTADNSTILGPSPS